MAPAHEHPGAQLRQLAEFQILFLQNTANEVLRHVGDEDNTQRALAAEHLVDDGGHLHLLEAHLYARLLQQVQVLHERLGAEGIALGCHGQRDPVLRPALAVIPGDAAAALHDGRDLSHQLPALLRQHHAPVAAAENGDAQFLLHLQNGGGQRRLGHEQVLGRPVHGAAAVHLQDIAHLQKRHLSPPFPTSIQDSAAFCKKNPRFNGGSACFD